MNDKIIQVLDLDLDLFLEDVCPLADEGKRPSLKGHQPWSETDVRRFLEDHCGLSAEHKVPGRIFDTHDKALHLWQELINARALSSPFTVVHADAHSDLGIGYPGPGIVLNGVLPVQMTERCKTERYYLRKQLDEANYLLFALAFRYIDKLVNIRNAHSKRDFPEIIRARDGANIHMVSPVSRIMEPLNGPEPIIQYCEYQDPFQYFNSDPYVCVSIAQSPRYSPKEADAILEIIKEYIQSV